MEEKVLETEAVSEKETTEKKINAKEPEKTTEAKSTAEKGSTKKGMDKKWGLLIGAVAAVCVGFFLLLTIIITIIVWPKKVNLNDYVTVEYEGYNTLGEAKVKIDEAAFLEKYGDKIKFSKKGRQKMDDKRTRTAAQKKADAKYKDKNKQNQRENFANVSATFRRAEAQQIRDTFAAHGVKTADAIRAAARHLLNGGTIPAQNPLTAESESPATESTPDGSDGDTVNG